MDRKPVACPGERLRTASAPRRSPGPYAGWWRIALVERVRILRDRYRDTLKKDRFTLGGVVFADLMPPGVAPSGGCLEGRDGRSDDSCSRTSPDVAPGMLMRP